MPARWSGGSPGYAGSWVGGWGRPVIELVGSARRRETMPRSPRSTGGTPRPCSRRTAKSRSSHRSRRASARRSRTVSGHMKIVARTGTRFIVPAQKELSCLRVTSGLIPNSEASSCPRAAFAGSSGGVGHGGNGWAGYSGPLPALGSRRSWHPVTVALPHLRRLERGSSLRKLAFPFKMRGAR